MLRDTNKDYFRKALLYCFISIFAVSSFPDSSPVVFIEHTAEREVVEQGMMGREKGRRRLGNPAFKMADRLMAKDR